MSKTPRETSSTDIRSPKKKKRKVQRYKKCVICRKRNFMNSECKCGEVTCLVHRHIEEHNCTFDWQTDSRIKLEESLQDAIPSKLEKC